MKSQKVEMGNTPEIHMRKASKKTFKKEEEMATVLTFNMSTWDKTHPFTSNNSKSLEKAQSLQSILHQVPHKNGKQFLLRHVQYLHQTT